MNTEERLEEIERELAAFDRRHNVPVIPSVGGYITALKELKAALNENQRLARAYQELLEATAYWGYVGV